VSRSLAHSPKCTHQPPSCPGSLLLLSLPSSTTCSTAQVKAGKKGKKCSITFHSIAVPTDCKRLINEKAEKGSRPNLGQNMNHHKTALTKIPI